MTCVYCGNGLSLLSTICSRCGKKYIGKTALVILTLGVALPSAIVGIGFLITVVLTKIQMGGY